MLTKSIREYFSGLGGVFGCRTPAHTIIIESFSLGADFAFELYPMERFKVCRRRRPRRRRRRRRRRRHRLTLSVRSN